MSALEAIRDQLRSRRAGLGDLIQRRQSMDDFGASRPEPAGSSRASIDLGNGLTADRLTGPGSRTARKILYVHGGAYISGSATSHRPMGHALVAGTQSIVTMLNYRLAPEHPFPAAAQDVATGFEAMAAEGGAYIVVGDSAGAGAALAGFILARDNGIPLPRAIVCISPWVDLTLAHDSHVRRADSDPMLTLDGLKCAAELYLSGTAATHPLASPLLADLSGLPPLLIQVGTDEILFDDATALAGRARSFGGPVRISTWDGMFHVWHAFLGMLPEADRAIVEICDFINDHFRDIQS